MRVFERYAANMKKVMQARLRARYGRTPFELVEPEGLRGERSRTSPERLTMFGTTHIWQPMYTHRT